MPEHELVRSALAMANEVRARLESGLPWLQFMFWTPKILLVILGTGATIVSSTDNPVGSIAIGGATGLVVGLQNLDFSADLPLVRHWIGILARFRRDAALRWASQAGTPNQALAAEQIVSQLRDILSVVRV